MLQQIYLYPPGCTRYTTKQVSSNGPSCSDVINEGVDDPGGGRTRRGDVDDIGGETGDSKKGKHWRLDEDDDEEVVEEV